jgi:hypothetical protein
MDLKNGTKKRTEKSTKESAKNPPKTANNCPKPAPNGPQSEEIEQAHEIAGRS